MAEEMTSLPKSKPRARILIRLLPSLFQVNASLSSLVRKCSVFKNNHAYLTLLHWAASHKQLYYSRSPILWLTTNSSHS